MVTIFRSRRCGFILKRPTMRYRHAIRLAGIALLAIPATQLRADIVIATPPGLTPGDTFRIVFVTDATTDAQSSDINYYNTFVNNDATAEAGGGSVTYNGIPLVFSAIASTSSVDAITNIGQTGSPVFLAGGNRIADSDTSSLSGLWSGALITPLNTDLLSRLQGNVVWTGTDPDGHGDVSYPLGSPAGLTGNDVQSGTEWTDYAPRSNTDTYAIYAISNTLTVTTPEPASIVLCLSAAACGAVIACGRRRRAAQRDC